jgi:hypothetical protein
LTIGSKRDDRPPLPYPADDPTASAGVAANDNAANNIGETRAFIPILLCSDVRMGIMVKSEIDLRAKSE